MRVTKQRVPKTVASLAFSILSYECRSFQVLWQVNLEIVHFKRNMKLQHRIDKFKSLNYQSLSVSKYQFPTDSTLSPQDRFYNEKISTE